MNHRSEKTVITVEIFQRTVIHSQPKTKVAWCGRCAAETVMLTPVEAVAHLQTTARDIFGRIESGEIHFSETESGSMLVCSGSPPLR